jgi:hypothetical protein
LETTNRNEKRNDENNKITGLECSRGWKAKKMEKKKARSSN